MASGSLPSSGSGALSLAPAGLRPIGGAWPGMPSSGTGVGGCRPAAGPVHGSAYAKGATSMATLDPITAEVIKTTEIRRRLDMSDLPGAGRHLDVSN
ncbi:hypothetical protein [Mycobacteroides chelonae]|uniref:hypothetical protein n=1 Tax=Mycobacteroides chelonae TaxID=1774 RepID=UPI001F47CE4C|nr:hypothetical protein [Mycobacteroides chelonae]